MIPKLPKLGFVLLYLGPEVSSNQRSLPAERGACSHECLEMEDILHCQQETLVDDMLIHCSFALVYSVQVKDHLALELKKERDLLNEEVCP